jgi:hypothetical protein
MMNLLLHDTAIHGLYVFPCTENNIAGPYELLAFGG